MAQVIGDEAREDGCCVLPCGCVGVGVCVGEGGRERARLMLGQQWNRNPSDLSMVIHMLVRELPRIQCFKHDKCSSLGGEREGGRKKVTGRATKNPCQHSVCSAVFGDASRGRRHTDHKHPAASSHRVRPRMHII